MSTPLPFYASRRACLITALAEARHTAALLFMKPVVKLDATGNEVRQKDSDLTLTDKQRARHTKVVAALAGEVRLYQKDPDVPTPDSGGLDAERERERLQDIANQKTAHLSESQFQALVTKWSGAPHTEDHKVNTDLRLAFPDLHPKITTPDGRIINDPDILRCSFCETFAHRSRMTMGNGPLQRTNKLEAQIINGINVVKEKVVYYSRKIVACPDCCLKVQSVRFPETRG